MNISPPLIIWKFYHKGRYPAVLNVKMPEENISAANVSKGEIARN